MVVITRNIHGAEITPWFQILDSGYRTLAIPATLLTRLRARQLIDVLHELNHARHSQRLGALNYSLMQEIPLMKARIEVLVQSRAIRQVERELGSLPSRLRTREQGYVEHWIQEHWDELLLEFHSPH